MKRKLILVLFSAFLAVLPSFAGLYLISDDVCRSKIGCTTTTELHTILGGYNAQTSLSMGIQYRNTSVSMTSLPSHSSTFVSADDFLQQNTSPIRRVTPTPPPGEVTGPPVGGTDAPLSDIPLDWAFLIGLVVMYIVIKIYKKNQKVLLLIK